MCKQKGVKRSAFTENICPRVDLFFLSFFIFLNVQLWRKWSNRSYSIYIKCHISNDWKKAVWCGTSQTNESKLKPEGLGLRREVPQRDTLNFTAALSTFHGTFSLSCGSTIAHLKILRSCKKIVINLDFTICLERHWEEEKSENS